MDQVLLRGQIHQKLFGRFPRVHDSATRFYRCRRPTDPSSFFKSILCRKIGFRMQGTHGDAAEIQLVQQLTDTALMQLNGKFVHDTISQIGTAPSHDTIFRQVRTILYPRGHLSHLRVSKTRCGARPRAFRQPSPPFGIVAVDTVAQCLSVHAARLSGHQPRMPIKDHRNGQYSPHLLGIGCAGRLGPQLRRIQILPRISTEAIPLSLRIDAIRIDSHPADFENSPGVTFQGRRYYFIGPPGTGKSHLGVALGAEAVKAGRNIHFITLADLIDALARAEREGSLRPENPLLRPIRPAHRGRDRLPAGTPGGGNLFFQLVNARHERAAMILTSNRGFAGGARFSAVPWSPPRRSIGSSTTSSWPRLKGSATGLRQHADLVPGHICSKALIHPPSASVITPQKRRGRPHKARGAYAAADAE
jgi:hypothetical protein